MSAMSSDIDLYRNVIGVETAIYDVGSWIVNLDIYPAFYDSDPVTDRSATSNVPHHSQFQKPLVF